jgi:hypothetical protein
MFETVSHGDPDMQLQRPAAVSDLFIGQNTNLRSEPVQLRIVAQSIQHFFSTFKSRYNGRYPNHVRAAFQAVTSAISCLVPPGGMAGKSANNLNGIKQIVYTRYSQLGKALFLFNAVLVTTVQAVDTNPHPGTAFTMPVVVSRQ